MVTKVEGVDGVRGLVGQPLGPSEWMTVTQEQVDLFADATDDHQWIHVDQERAKDGPFGGTIAHGYLTLALIPRFLPRAARGHRLRHGHQLRRRAGAVPHAVPVGGGCAPAAVVDEVTDVKGGLQMQVTVTLELEDDPKPALVAVVLLRRYL